ncbi:MAG: polysaccharide pyruvyl transferase family protein [Parabacteroides sp.]|nr:polysaccharide pyruvyl transferase family protein [Parabacteroides sp.]
MKVALITTSNAANYGAVLQAYALKMAIINMGHSCDIIDYRPETLGNGRRLVFRSFNIKLVFHSLKNVMNFSLVKVFRKKLLVFDEFRNKYLLSGKKTYKTYEDMISDFPEYDVYICGSDQIWNTHLTYSKVFFLRFEIIRPQAVFVAYAPSFPQVESDSDKMILRKNTKHFDYLSARESESAELLSKITGRDVKHVIDPVFLLSKEDWQKFCIANTSVLSQEPYILIYFIGDNATGVKAAEILRKKFKLKMIEIRLSNKSNFDVDFVAETPTPQEVVSLINSAAYICTNSFHGTAFSIILEKKFLTIGNPKRNSRMTSLLETAGMKDRFITEDNLGDIEIILPKLENNPPTKGVDALIDFSKDYLSKAIGGSKNAY